MSLVVSLLNQLGLFSWIQGFPVVGVNSFGLHIFHLPKLVIWKVFLGRLLTYQHIQNKGLPICSMCTLCEKHEESIQHLLLNVLMLCVFWVGFDTFFLLIISLIRRILFLFIKSDGSPLVKLIKLAVITFSIWMIWRMRNYARFQDKIAVSRAILVIKDLTCIVSNSSKASMKNDMFDFNVIKFFLY